MSKDSSFTYIHLHASHHADLFEEFCHPPSSGSPNNPANITASNQQSQSAPNTDPSDPSLSHIPGHFLPFESINLPPHLMPLNPEDEDGVVPDMHAAFGIARAMQGAGAPEVSGERSGRGVTNGGAGGGEGWMDLGLEGLVGGLSIDESGGTGNGGRTTGTGDAGVRQPVRGEHGRAVGGPRREGRRGGILSVR